MGRFTQDSGITPAAVAVGVAGAAAAALGLVLVLELVGDEAVTDEDSFSPISQDVHDDFGWVPGGTSEDPWALVPVPPPTAPVPTATDGSDEATLTGVVYMPDGSTPAPHATVSASSAWSGTQWTTNADNQGTYEFPDLPLEPVILLATTVDDYVMFTGGSGGTLSTGGAVVTVDIVLAPYLGTEQLTGVINGDTSEVAAGFFQCSQSTQPVSASLELSIPALGWVANTTSSPFGLYAFTDVPWGFYTLTATHPDGRTAVADGFRATDSTSNTTQTVHFCFEPIEGPGLVLGSVYDEDCATPIAAAEVIVQASTGLAVGPALTEATGSFGISNVPPGDFTATATHPSDGRTGAASENLPAGQQRSVTICLGQTVESGLPGGTAGATTTSTAASGLPPSGQAEETTTSTTGDSATAPPAGTAQPTTTTSVASLTLGDGTYSVPGQIQPGLWVFSGTGCGWVKSDAGGTEIEKGESDVVVAAGDTTVRLLGGCTWTFQG